MIEQQNCTTLAAHAHSVQLIAHRKGDYLTAHELTKQAHDHSMNAQKITEKLPSRTNETAR